jgi:very-short-patch-repair endonuclease/DNA-directed RNA polymerase subunit RPC12/RpoP
MKEKVLERIHNDIEKKYNIILLDEYKGTGIKHPYNWKCGICGNIFSASIRYDIPIQCKKCFPDTRFQKTAKTKIRLEREKIKEKIEDRYGTILLDEYKGKAFINSKGLKENYLYNWKCGACGQNFKAAVRFDRNLSCPNCNPFQHGSSKGQKELTEDLSVYGFKIIPMDRSVLEGKEIDIYFSDLKFGIEYDGAHWHNKKDDAEKNKIAEDKGIEIYRINDVDFCKNKNNIEKNLIDYMEQKFNIKMTKTKETEHTKTFSKGREVECNGIIYKNVDDASEKTGVGKSQIYNSCRTGHKAHGRFFSWHKIS